MIPHGEVEKGKLGEQRMMKILNNKTKWAKIKQWLWEICEWWKRRDRNGVQKSAVTRENASNLVINNYINFYYKCIYIIGIIF